MPQWLKDKIERPGWETDGHGVADSGPTKIYGSSHNLRMKLSQLHRQEVPVWVCGVDDDDVRYIIEKRERNVKVIAPTPSPLLTRLAKEYPESEIRIGYCPTSCVVVGRDTVYLMSGGVSVGLRSKDSARFIVQRVLEQEWDSAMDVTRF